MTRSSTMNYSGKWKFISLADSLPESTDINYVRAPTSEELKQKIFFSIQSIQLDDIQNALFQFWGAQQAGNTFLLTITNQPSGLYGNDTELLWLYHKACLENKFYVHPGKKKAFGLIGEVFLTRTPVQTQDVLKYYREDERPPSFDNAILSRRWGSFAVPVIVDGLCVGVLEFFLDTPKDSYDSDIDKVYTALKMERPFQNARVQTLIQNEERKRSNKMLRKSMSFDYSKYSRLAPYFGLTRSDAEAKLGLKRSTFGNVCKRVGIYEWPWVRIPSANPEIQINLAAASETSSSQILDAMEDKPGYSDDSSSYMEIDPYYELPQEQTTNARAPIPETEIDQIAVSEIGGLQIPVDTLENMYQFSRDWSFNSDTDTFGLPCEQTINAGASDPESQIDQVDASETSPYQIPVDIQEDNGFFVDYFSYIETLPYQLPVDILDYDLSDSLFYDMDLDTNELPWEQTINPSLFVPETQINETAAYVIQNTTNLSDIGFGMDMAEYDEMYYQTTKTIAEYQGNLALFMEDPDWFIWDDPKQNVSDLIDLDNGGLIEYNLMAF